MNWKSYLLVCLGVSALVVVTLLLFPGIADSIERELLTFLSTNAR